jgi:hypothetical protein
VADGLRRQGSSRFLASHQSVFIGLDRGDEFDFVAYHGYVSPHAVLGTQNGGSDIRTAVHFLGEGEWCAIKTIHAKREWMRLPQQREVSFRPDYFVAVE